MRIKVDQRVRAALITDYFYSKVATKEFKIAHQNIRSISGKIEELRLIISEVKSSFHLLTFSETWPTKKYLIRSLKYPVINSFVLTEAAGEVVSWFTQELM